MSSEQTRPVTPKEDNELEWQTRKESPGDHLKFRSIYTPRSRRFRQSSLLPIHLIQGELL